MGIKKARTKEVRTLSPVDLSVTLKPAVQIAQMYLPQRAKQTQLLTGDARQSAASLVEKLRFEARVL
jgi:electron transfer flavoprotein beta subunit